MKPLILYTAILVATLLCLSPTAHALCIVGSGSCAECSYEPGEEGTCATCMYGYRPVEKGCTRTAHWDCFDGVDECVRCANATNCAECEPNYDLVMGVCVYTRCDWGRRRCTQCATDRQSCLRCQDGFEIYGVGCVHSQQTTTPDPSTPPPDSGSPSQRPPVGCSIPLCDTCINGTCNTCLKGFEPSPDGMSCDVIDSVPPPCWPLAAVTVVCVVASFIASTF